MLPQLPVTALLGRPFLAQQDAVMFVKEGVVSFQECGVKMALIPSDDHACRVMRAARASTTSALSRREVPPDDWWVNTPDKKTVTRAVGVLRETTVAPYLTEGMVEMDVRVTEGPQSQGKWYANVRVADAAKQNRLFVLEDEKGIPVVDGVAKVVLINGARSTQIVRALAAGEVIADLREHDPRARG